MTSQLKRDLKTIFEILSYLFCFIVYWWVFNHYPWLANLWFAVSITASIYNSYLRRTNSNIISFATTNDEAYKMTYVSFGIILLFLSAIGHFALKLNIYYFIIGITISIILCLFGIFSLPKGWIYVKDYALNIYGVEGGIDTRQLQAITLEKDKIILTDIHGQNKNSSLVNLNQIASTKIKNFLENKLKNNQVTIFDNVVDLV